MTEQFEYWIRKVLNKVLVQLICFILAIALLIVVATLFKFNYVYLYIIIGILFLLGIGFNYWSYRRNIWLIKHYQRHPKMVMARIKNYKKENKWTYLFYFLMKKSCHYYDEALHALGDK